MLLSHYALLPGLHLTSPLGKLLPGTLPPPPPLSSLATILQPQSDFSRLFHRTKDTLFPPGHPLPTVPPC